MKHSDLDERALDALKEFPVEGALAVLKQFLESNLVRTLTLNRKKNDLVLSGTRVKQVSVSVRGDEDLSSEDQSWRIRHQRWISASPGTRRGQDQSYSGEDRY